MLFAISLSIITAFYTFASTGFIGAPLNPHGVTRCPACGYSTSSGRRSLVCRFKSDDKGVPASELYKKKTTQSKDVRRQLVDAEGSTVSRPKPTEKRGGRGAGRGTNGSRSAGGAGRGRSSQSTPERKPREKGEKMNWDEFREREMQPGAVAAASRLPPEGDELKCPHFGTCPGCVVDREFTSTPIMVEAASFCDTQMALAARAKLGVRGEKDAPKYSIAPVLSPHEWRTHAKLVVGRTGKYGGIKLGLYKEHSHDVMTIPECRVHHPAINEAATVITQAAAKVRTVGYDEEKMEGMLRYVQLSVERSTGKVQLTLVWNAHDYREATPHLQLLVKELKAKAPDLWHSIWANFHDGPGNAIMSRSPHSWHRCSGPEYLLETVKEEGLPFSFSPQVFRQANLDAFSAVARTVTSWVPEGAAVCELYAGVGLLGLTVATEGQGVEWVRCSDMNPFNVRAFGKAQARLRDREMATRMSYQPYNAVDALEEGEAEDATCMIVDPPRKGLDAPVLSALRERGSPLAGSVRRIIYVSCGFEALRRDAAALADGGWRMIHAEGHVLFPGTDHIETVAIFDR